MLSPVEARTRIVLGELQLGMMRTNVVMLHSSDKLSVAEDIMSMGRIRHVPVVDARNHVVGIVTQRDLYKAAISPVLEFDRAKEHE